MTGVSFVDGALWHATGNDGEAAEVRRWVEAEGEGTAILFYQLTRRYLGDQREDGLRRLRCWLLTATGIIAGNSA